MARVNPNYLKLSAGYLFPEIDRRVRLHLEAHPEARDQLVNCGVGDVTQPLPAVAIEAMHRAVDDLADPARFQGYGPPTGHAFLREAIAQHAFGARGVSIDPDEIFISDGSKGDAGSVLELLGPHTTVAVYDPVYPVYVDTNVMFGNTGEGLDDGGYDGVVYLQATRENGFQPTPPAGKDGIDVVYICSPNNPTGSVATRTCLEQWVAWAQAHDVLIIFDAAYEAFINDDSLPHSIYEIPGATRCAIELRSFSKNGGFTGVRCGYSVCPRALEGTLDDGSRQSVHALWTRRWQTRSNGVSWPVQNAAASLFTDDGREQVQQLIAHYRENASLLREAVLASGLEVFGGEHAPYLWVACPDGLSSWEAFDMLLEQQGIVTTPGAGFGRCGEGFFRISAFNGRAEAQEAANRFRKLQWMART